MQGRVGGLYARAAGQPADVAQAIAEQYLPLSATAPVPAGLAGGLLAVADKADNIVGAWAAGEKPSGSRDPYGLRRAAMGIVRIALEFALRFGVEDLLSAALAAYDEQGVAHSDGIVAEAAAFVWERLQGCSSTRGCPSPWSRPPWASSAADIPARAARARSFAALEGRDFFDDVVTTYSRCASLAVKASGEAPAAVDEALFSRAGRGRAARGPGRRRRPCRRGAGASRDQQRARRRGQAAAGRRPLLRRRPGDGPGPRCARQSAGTAGDRCRAAAPIWATSVACRCRPSEPTMQTQGPRPEQPGGTHGSRSTSTTSAKATRR